MGNSWRGIEAEVRHFWSDGLGTSPTSEDLAETVILIRSAMAEQRRLNAVERDVLMEIARGVLSEYGIEELLAIATKRGECDDR